VSGYQTRHQCTVQQPTLLVYNRPCSCCCPAAARCTSQDQVGQQARQLHYHCHWPGHSNTAAYPARQWCKTWAFVMCQQCLCSHGSSRVISTFGSHSSLDTCAVALTLKLALAVPRSQHRCQVMSVHSSAVRPIGHAEDAIDKVSRSNSTL
jgi:hypothetical protein